MNRLRKAWQWAKGNAHHVRAAAWFVGDLVSQVVRTAGGFETVAKWTRQQWTFAVMEAVFPALLLWLRAGDKNPTPEELADQVARVQAQRAAQP